MEWTLRVAAAVALGMAIRYALYLLWGGAARMRPDLTEGQPDVSEAAKLFKAQRWDDLATLYANRSPADRVHFLEGLAAQTKLDAPLPPEPSGDLAIVAAGLCLGWAWRHRGDGIDVTRRGAINMFRLLDTARHYVERAEADSVACAIQIRIEMGLDGNFGALQRQLNMAATLDEANIMLARNHLTFVAPKWHGSLDEMFAVAREYAAVPKSPAWLTLLAMAHIEALLFRTLMSDNNEDRLQAHHYYVDGEEYLHELEALDDAFWRARNTSQMLSHAESVFAHNTMAYALYRRGLTVRMGAHLERVGDNLTKIPWGYSGITPTPAAADELRRLAHLGI